MKIFLLITGLFLSSALQAQSNIRLMKLKSDEPAERVKTYKIHSNQLVEVRTKNKNSYKARISFISEDTISLDSTNIGIDEIESIKFSPRRRIILEAGIMVVGSAYILAGAAEKSYSARIGNPSSRRFTNFSGDMGILIGVGFYGTSTALIMDNWENAKRLKMKYSTYTFK